MVPLWAEQPYVAWLLGASSIMVLYLDPLSMVLVHFVRWHLLVEAKVGADRSVVCLNLCSEL